MFDSSLTNMNQRILTNTTKYRVAKALGLEKAHMHRELFGIAEILHETLGLYCRFCKNTT
ncbi:hypothetical protein HanOQP8_Chr14g0524701 [Helianthus annuus]|nr:hypothetical protein HanOQP8_Chr14g0524701 [Helianthus annuus]